MPTRSIHVSSIRPLSRILFEPVQEHLSEGQAGQATVPGGCWGRGGVGSVEEEGLAASPDVQGTPPSPGVWIAG